MSGTSIIAKIFTSLSGRLGDLVKYSMSLKFFELGGTLCVCTDSVSITEYLDKVFVPGQLFRATLICWFQHRDYQRPR